MCIRDSDKPFAAWTLAPTTVVVPTTGTVEVGVLAKNTGNTCLLYTSDAADERSSVDLGGRRIIKKKNTTENSG